MHITTDAKNLIALINNNGYKAYAVGGCVRDYLMGRTAGDIDICSSATPQQLETLLSANNIKYVETGIKHGTVTAIINHTPYEVTTFRCDGNYVDNRHPDSVQFVSDIKYDLSRRDFTVNAIAYNDADGFVDLFGGRADINAKIIRCVGNPNTRFQEDALRIMRAIRFASTLCFDIEPATKQAIFDNMHLLKNIAVERIFTELKKLLLGDNVEKVLLEYKDVIAIIIPELAPCFDYPQHTKWHLYDVYTHIVKSVAVCPKVDYIRLTLLLHDIGKPHCRKTDDRGVDHFKGHPQLSADMANDILRRLRVSNDIRNKVVCLIYNHDDYIKDNKPNIKHWLNSLGEQMTLDYIDVKIADLKSHNLVYSQAEIDNLNIIKQLTLDIINSNEPYKLSQLAINGKDLKKLGIIGEDISAKLNYLLNLVIDDPSLNQKQILIKKLGL